MWYDSVGPVNSFHSFVRRQAAQHLQVSCCTPPFHADRESLHMLLEAISKWLCNTRLHSGTWNLSIVFACLGKGRAEQVAEAMVCLHMAQDSFSLPCLHQSLLRCNNSLGSKQHAKATVRALQDSWHLLDLTLHLAHEAFEQGTAARQCASKVGRLPRLTVQQCIRQPLPQKGSFCG